MQKGIIRTYQITKPKSTQIPNWAKEKAGGVQKRGVPRNGKNNTTKMNNRGH